MQPSDRAPPCCGSSSSADARGTSLLGTDAKLTPCGQRAARGPPGAWLPSRTSRSSTCVQGGDQMVRRRFALDVPFDGLLHE